MMNGFVLRLLAMSTMFVDHIGWIFLDNPMYLTWIGRIAFPLYAFLLAEGFLIIHSDQRRFIKHLSVIILLVFISEPGYDFMEYGLDFTRYMDSQNNMLTLLFGYLEMMITEVFLPSSGDKRQTTDTKKYYFPVAIIYLILGLANYSMKSNYNIMGPILVVAFYWYIRTYKRDAAEGRAWSHAKRLSFSFLLFACYLILYFWVRSGFGNFTAWTAEVTAYAPWIIGYAMAAVIVGLYNGELGYHEKWFSRFYTSFYPLHMYLIGFISLCATM